MARSRHPWNPVCPPPRGLVRPVRQDVAGALGPTRGQAAGPRWRQTSHGFYVPSWVDGERPEQRIMEQSVRLPPGGAVTGWAGCRLAGAAFFDGRLPDGRTPIPVPLATGGRNIRGDDEVVRLWDRLDRAEIVTRFGIPCAREQRSLFDEMRRGNLREAVVAMDMMAAADLVSVRRMRSYAAARARVRGVVTVTRALDLANEYSRSPNETRMRLVWVLDAGLPAPLINQPVFDRSGRLIGIVDLLDVDAGLVGEYDGADHRGAHRHSSDVGREDRLRGVGLEVFRVTGPDLPHTDRVVTRMRTARGRARWQPPGDRAWTVTPPDWWEVAPGLDELLDERDAVRSLY